MTRAEEIAANLARVHARIAAAARAAGRPPGAVRLIAVSKKMPADDVRAALAAGQRAFGENYAQELRDKSALLAADRALSAQPEWHFIGPLQSNKVKYVAGKAALVHSIDSPRRCSTRSRRAAVHKRASSRSTSPAKRASSGVAPAELPALLDRFATMTHVRCAGLMLIPPLRRAPRPHFAALRALRDREAAIRAPTSTCASCRWG